MQKGRENLVPSNNIDKNCFTVGTLTFLFLFLTLLFGESGNIHLKSVRTARTAYLVLSRLFGQSQNVSAFLASAVNVSLSVAYTVTLEAEKGHEAFSKPQKICVFLSATVEIL